jgi:tetratricopeptide (TPR) repeat protein
MNAKDYYNQGSVHFDKIEGDQAIADFTEAIRLDPNYAEAYYKRGLSYSMYSVGEYGKALTDFEMAVSIDPANSHYLKSLKKARARVGYGFSIVGGIVGGIIGGIIGSNGGGWDTVVVAIIVGILIGGVRRVRHTIYKIIRNKG